MRFRLACAQFAPVKKAIESNLDKIAQMCLEASAEGADVIVFPEGATAGYFLEGGVLECAISSSELLAGLTGRLQKLSRPLDVVVGFYESDNGELYNSCGYFEVGPSIARTVAVYRKFFLPTYGVFDEERFVGRGTELAVFDTRFGRVAMLICEDVWHSIMPTLCAVRGANLILAPSASPARDFSQSKPGNVVTYEKLLTGIASEHNVFVGLSSLCGFEGGKGFAGGSMIIDPSGEILVEGPLQDEHIVIAELDLDEVGIARARSPLLSDLRAAWSDIVKLATESE